jgi:hypothetical protein
MDASDPAMGPRSSDMAARALDTRLMMECGELPLLRFRDFRSQRDGADRNGDRRRENGEERAAREIRFFARIQKVHVLFPQA